MIEKLFANSIDAIDLGDTCGLRGCDGEIAETVELLPLDPIDHEMRVLPVCDAHISWSERRNEVAELVYEDFREAREEIGEQYKGLIDEVNMPDGVEGIGGIERSEIMREMYDGSGAV